MSLALLGGALIGTAAIAVTYRLGKRAADEPTGCNGHHWGEVRLPDDDGVSTTQRHDAFKAAGQYENYPNIARKPQEHYEAVVLTNTVVLRGKGIKTCQDCGAHDVVDVTVGGVSRDKFEE